ncbi:MAG: ACT domain-containing protein, partial [Tolypothrix sp. T3-bin4]|nr:ACT domain-containing protein [Tolypothrix sp. T3-bin4]
PNAAASRSLPAPASQASTSSAAWATKPKTRTVRMRTPSAGCGAGMAAKLFGLLAQHNISVDMIIQSQRCRIVDGVPRRDIAFTVARMDGEAAQKMLQQAAVEFGWGEVVLDNAIAKVSIVGAGMVGQPGVAAKMFEAIAQHQINIQMIATSEIKISCVVDQEQGVKALQVIHAAFGLAGTEKFVVPA